MRLKNEVFASVLDWLIRHHYVIDQRDLANKTGITATTISRIMTGKVEPKDGTLRKLNAAFDDMFSMQYLRGLSTTMLVADLGNPLPIPDIYQSRAAEHTQHAYADIPQWANTLIDTLNKQIQKNEALSRELRSTINEVNTLRTDLQALLKKLKK